MSICVSTAIQLKVLKCIPWLRKCTRRKCPQHTTHTRTRKIPKNRCSRKFFLSLSNCIASA